jgi:glucose/arabinose dehydrogenase
VVSGLPGGSYHNGGGVAFGDDGMLYVSNGEIHSSERAQDPQALGGKIYRYTPDGGIPDDNPFGDSPAFAIGLRNPFGLAIDPVSGAPFVTENGPTSFDEINRIVAGGNYGWPVFNGPAPGNRSAGRSGLPGDYQDPIFSYRSIIVPTGIAFADPDSASEPVSGDLFFATYAQQSIHRLVLNGDRDQVIDTEIFFESPEPIVALAWGPRGLYFSTPGAVKLFRLAREAAPEATGSPGPAETTGAGPGPTVDREPASSTPVALWLFGAAAAVLLAALWYAFGPRRGRT